METDQLLPWRHALRTYLGISATSAWRKAQVDPQFAKLKLNLGNGRYGARLSEVQAYIAAVPRAGADGILDPERRDKLDRAVLAMKRKREKQQPPPPRPRVTSRTPKPTKKTVKRARG